jgi:hypothetical protein
MEPFEEVLFSDGYESSKVLIRDWALLACLARIEEYRAECEFFQKKHGMSMRESESCLHEEKGHEDFKKEDDLADWQFSLETLEWWEEKARNMQK